MKDKRTRKISRKEEVRDFNPLFLSIALSSFSNVFHISFPPSVLAALILCDTLEVKTINQARQHLGTLQSDTLIRLQRSEMIEKTNVSYKPTERGKEAIERYFMYIKGVKKIAYKINLLDVSIKQSKKTTFNPFAEAETKNNTRKKQLKQQAKHKKE